MSFLFYPYVETKFVWLAHFSYYADRQTQDALTL